MKINVKKIDFIKEENILEIIISISKLVFMSHVKLLIELYSINDFIMQFFMMYF
jgi:hypothetical protein